MANFIGAPKRLLDELGTDETSKWDVTLSYPSDLENVKAFGTIIRNGISDIAKSWGGAATLAINGAQVDVKLSGTNAQVAPILRMLDTVFNSPTEMPLKYRGTRRQTDDMTFQLRKACIELGIDDPRVITSGGRWRTQCFAQVNGPAALVACLGVAWNRYLASLGGLSIGLT